LLAQDTQLTRRVGAIAIVVIALLISFFVFIYDRIEWGRHVRIRVYFHSTGGLVEGAPFVVAGRDIGTIEAIALSPKGAKSPLLGDEGIEARVAIAAEEAAPLVQGDVFVASRGTLGAKYLELGPAEDGSRVPVREGDRLLGRDPPEIDRVLEHTLDNVDTVGSFADALRPEYAALVAELAKASTTMREVAPQAHLADDLDALVAEAHRTYDAIGNRPGVDRLEALADHTRTTIERARATFAALSPRLDALSAGIDALRTRLGTKGVEALDKIELAIDRIRAAINKIDPLLAQVDELQQRIARGEGSLLKLMNDPEFPDDAKELGKVLKRHPWKVMDHPSQ
jgi:ABC-type transporter Mla subunit MlaD